MLNKKYGMLQKLGIKSKEHDVNDHIKFFVKPTPISIFVQHKKGL